MSHSDWSDLLFFIWGGVFGMFLSYAVRELANDWAKLRKGRSTAPAREPDPAPAPVLQGTHTVTHNTFAGGGESTTDKWEVYGPAPLTPPHTPTPYSPEELRSFGGFNAPPTMDTPISELFAEKVYAWRDWTTRTQVETAPDDPTAEDDDAPCVSVTDIADLVQALHDYNGGQRPLPTDNEIRQFAYLAWLWCARHPNQIYSEFPPYRGARPDPTVHFAKEP